PKQEYEGTRHNVGQDLVRAIEPDAKAVELDVYMNNSGPALKRAVGSPKNLIVVHDELDLPLGKVKISYGSSAGGHNGVKSVIKALKTADFARIRVGISPSTPSGKLRRPDGEKIVYFVLGKFRPPEREKLKKVKKLVAEAIELIIESGVERA